MFETSDITGWLGLDFIEMVEDLQFRKLEQKVKQGKIRVP
jgi:hypothetical protein